MPVDSTSCRTSNVSLYVHHRYTHSRIPPPRLSSRLVSHLCYQHVRQAVTSTRPPGALPPALGTTRPVPGSHRRPCPPGTLPYQARPGQPPAMARSASYRPASRFTWCISASSTRPATRGSTPVLARVSTRSPAPAPVLGSHRRQLPAPGRQVLYLVPEKYFFHLFI